MKAPLLDAYSMLLLGSTYNEERIKKKLSTFQCYFKPVIDPLKLVGETELSHQLEKFMVEAPSITSSTCFIFAKKLEEVSCLRS